MFAPDVEAMTRSVLQQVTGSSSEPPLSARLREDLGIDSLNLVAVVFELESRLGVKIVDDSFRLSSIATVEDLVRFMSRIR